MNKKDKYIKNHIDRAADNYTFPESQLEAIHRKLSEEKKGEVIVMKKKTYIKVAAAALALVVCSGTVGFAAGRASQWISWGGSDYSTDFNDFEKTTSSFGESTVLKEFSNGFAFKGVSNGGSAVKDADGNTMGEGTRMDVTYTKDGIDIMYTVEKGASTVYDDISSGATADFTNGDTKYYFHELKNKFVPTNYEMSAEEEALVEAGELNVGYGSEKVEEKISQSIYWEKDGNIYSLFGFDTGLSADDFFEMAKELS